MSKYIRTENGIYDTSKGIYTPIIKMWAISTVTIYDEDIIKESDYLEELCDEFILFDNENKIHYKSQEGSIWWLGASCYPKSVRGAIFTDKGIKYVAKMNENNELELI